MDPSPDELAGTVDGFGGLTRDELIGALADIAARTGTDFDRAGASRAIDDAIDAYYLLETEVEAIDGSDVPPDEASRLLVAGPAALPRLPEGGEDLPYLLDIEPRDIDRGAVANQVEGRLRADAAGAIADGDDRWAEQLLDACFEVEAWGPIDLDDAKAGLADLLDSGPQD